MTDYTKQPTPPVLRWAREGDSGDTVLFHPKYISHIVANSCGDVTTEYVKQHQKQPDKYMRPAVIDTEATERAAEMQNQLRQAIDFLCEPDTYDKGMQILHDLAGTGKDLKPATVRVHPLVEILADRVKRCENCGVTEGDIAPQELGYLNIDDDVRLCPECLEALRNPLRRSE